MLRKCACHEDSHREESLTVVFKDDLLEVDPVETSGKVVYFCARWMRERQRQQRALEAGRRAYQRAIRQEARA